ncbi:MAG: hypothetical protein P4M11_08790 [Candidatus Pacebacteria bacterium]|nr:hypothetical protein [Candidatus Paceibacterota bacterium]
MEVALVADELRKVMQALEKELGEDIMLAKCKREIMDTQRETAEISAMARKQIGMLEKELNARKKRVTMADIETKKRMDKVMKKLNARQRAREKIKAAIAAEAMKVKGSLAGQQENCYDAMVRGKKLLAEADEIKVGEKVMQKFVYDCGESKKELEKAYQDMKIRMLGEDEVEGFQKRIKGSETAINEYRRIIEQNEKEQVKRDLVNQERIKALVLTRTSEK